MDGRIHTSVPHPHSPRYAHPYLHTLTHIHRHLLEHYHAVWYGSFEERTTNRSSELDEAPAPLTTDASEREIKTPTVRYPFVGVFHAPMG